jgi:uncharacterized protein (DUF736 family)
VIAEDVEGAAWKRTAEKSGNEYLSVTLDSFNLAEKVYCRLVEADKGFNLVWSRD